MAHKRQCVEADAEDMLVAKLNALYLKHNCQHLAIEEHKHPFRFNPRKKAVRTTDVSLRSAWLEYKVTVQQLTERQPLHKLKNFELRGWKEWHVDHVLSIHEGFRRGLPPDSIAHISNLRMLPAGDNLKKKDRTVFTNLFNE